MAILDDFDKKSFLKEGAVFGKQGQAWLLWGAPIERSIRPEAIAISTSNFHDKEDVSWKLFPYAIQCSWGEAKALFHSTQGPWVWSEASRPNFQTQFEMIQGDFKSKKLTKAVPYVFEKSEKKISHIEVEHLLSHVFSQKSGYIYGSWSEDVGFLGLTPETLVSQVAHQSFETMALAGTTSIEEFEENSKFFLEDPKERVEHEKVVEDIVNQLGVYGALEVSETKIKTTPHLAHLFTEIQLTTKKYNSVESLVKRLHPTPALGCFPRSEVTRVMNAFEKIEPRGVFGAPFGISFSQSSADFVVAIRNIIWNEKETLIGSGCGIVEASEFEKEWKELKSKRNSVKKIFGVQ